MNRNKILVVLVVILLLGNGLLAWLYLGRDKGPRARGEGRRQFMQNQLKKEVGFTDEQVARFDSLREKHRREMEPLFDSLKALRAQLFAAALNSNSDSALNAIAHNNHFQQQLDIQFFKNLREARKICTAEQLPKFDSVMKRMALMQPGARGGKPKR